MFLHCELLILILVLTLHGQVHTGEIIGGQEAVPHSRPYMVLLEVRTDGKLKHCGGFLLNEDFVMTAAHCGANHSSYKALLGVHDVHNRADIQTISVEKKYPHEDFIGVKNDIMLLKLSSKANFSKDVKPIALADQGDDFLPTNCTVSGWGRSVQNSIYMTNVLMEVNVTLVDSEQCAQDNVYCSEGETGPRKGDSGGPLVCGDGKAYGLVCALNPDPDAPKKYIYTKIPDYRSWIDSIMKP
ncbi:duodenase-1-like [Sebastes umbrosus]|uniref:duodenase-1-like n=1 Tax=Sebastes umbrosus TaxID=72105 RepID=UPI00189CA7D9|nr:duodenase-1-like [Sebastes umbrosus]XP_037625721.1 duodenase-1-like [Sebastes umbrosus]